MRPTPTPTLPGHTSPIKPKAVQQQPQQQQQQQQQSSFTTKTQPGSKNTMPSNNTSAQSQSQQSQEANQQHAQSCSAISDKNKRALWANDTPPPFTSSSHQSCHSGDDCTNNSTPSTLLSSASTIKSKASVDEVPNSENSYGCGMGDSDGHLDMHANIVSRQQLLEIPDLEERPHSAGRLQVHPSMARSGSGSGSRQFQNTNANTGGNALGSNTVNTALTALQYNELSNFRLPHALVGPNTNAHANASTNNAPRASGSAPGPPSHVNIFTKPSRIQPSAHWTQPSYQQIASRNQHQLQPNNVQSQAGSHSMNVPPDYYSAPMQSAPQTPQRSAMSYVRQPYHQTPPSGSGRARSASGSEHAASRNPMHSPSQHNWTHQRQNLHQRQNPHQHQPSRTAHHLSGKHTVPNSPSGHHPRQPFSPGGARSAPEHLKTLLRKKACLYEPGTSRAIALITWLVGRKLALQNGYFSRQKLQSGVHAVVAKKIDSDLITRTKVNRCMQIILNSCFHYIIPRPDGTEENGEAFRTLFKEGVVDDTHLLKSLLAPWDDLDISEADKVVNCEDETLFENDDEHSNCNEGKFRKVKTPKNSKANKEKVKHKNSKSSSPDNVAGDSQSQKRKVLLCFNENVRSAEDVLRCHNEFIRDAAISSDLYLSSDEWRYFYSRKDDDESQTIGTADSTTSYGPGVYSSPMIRGNEGPYLSFDIPSEVSDSLAFNDPETSGRNADALGQMNCNELSKFRTTWCCKRYEHDAKLCRFAHVNENNGWLRRDPNVSEYAANLCPSVATINNIDSIINGCHVNACKDGLLCKFAHSQEEVDYHPIRYKSLNCTNETRPCNLLDICPHSHTFNDHRHRPNRNRGDSISSGRGLRSTSVVSADGGNGYEIPAGSPVLYLSPAPMSEFDNSFNFAGLQSLFRRNCTVYYAHHTGVDETKYDLFKDTCGIEKPLFEQEDGHGRFSLYTH